MAQAHGRIIGHIRGPEVSTSDFTSRSNLNEAQFLIGALLNLGARIVHPPLVAMPAHTFTQHIRRQHVPVALKIYCGQEG